MEGLEAIFRWMHVFVGIIWIGHLYFFNWVNGPFTAKLDPPTRKAVVPELMPRALYWFRWGAAYTWITGVLLLLLVYYHGQQALAAGAEWSAGAIIMIAVTFLAVFVYDMLHPIGLAAERLATFMLGLVAYMFGWAIRNGGVWPKWLAWMAWLVAAVDGVVALVFSEFLPVMYYGQALFIIWLAATAVVMLAERRQPQ